MKSSFLVYLFFKPIFIGYVTSEDKELCEELGVGKFPTIRVYENIENGLITDEPVITTYQGALKINDIFDFLNKFALPIKRYQTLMRGAHGLDESSRTRNYKLFNLNATNYGQWFAKKNINEKVLIYFGKHSEHKNATQFMDPEYKLIFKTLHGHAKQAYINCDEPREKEVCENVFLIKKTPAIRFYKALDDIETRVKKAMQYSADDPKEFKSQILKKYYGYNTVSEHTNKDSLYTQYKLHRGRPMLFLVTQSPNELNVPFYILSNDMYIAKYWSFNHIIKPTDEIIDQLQVTSLPSLVALFPDTSDPLTG